MPLASQHGGREEGHRARDGGRRQRCRSPLLARRRRWLLPHLSSPRPPPSPLPPSSACLQLPRQGLLRMGSGRVAISGVPRTSSSSSRPAAASAPGWCAAAQRAMRGGQKVVFQDAVVRRYVLLPGIFFFGRNFRRFRRKNRIFRLPPVTESRTKILVFQKKISNLMIFCQIYKFAWEISNGIWAGISGISENR